MKIYLASSLSHECRPDMYEALKRLRDNGHEVYGPVEHTIKNAWDYSNKEWGRLVFEEDIRAINAADCIVAISYGRTKTTSGCSWEIGYAYGIGKKWLSLKWMKVHSLLWYPTVVMPHSKVSKV